MEATSFSFAKSSEVFFKEASNYPAIISRIDQQFRDCLLAQRLGCQAPRDILPFCGKVFEMTLAAYKMKNENQTMFNAWVQILDRLCKEDGIEIERFSLPPTHLRFPLSRAILKGKTITFDKISFLDSTNTEILEKVLKKCLRITEQSCGYSAFSETSLRMMLCGKNTLCAYSTTTEGRITAVLWGIKMSLRQEEGDCSCFYILFAAREPEYYGQNIYEKMVAAFEPQLTKEGQFKSEFLCWKQGKENAINNQALDKYIREDLEVIRAESEPYSFEPADHCVLKLDPNTRANMPSEAELGEALKAYCFEVGDLFTFATEYPMLMFKIKLFWGAWYNQTFPKPDNYPTSLQPFYT